MLIPNLTSFLAGSAALRLCDANPVCGVAAGLFLVLKGLTCYLVNWFIPTVALQRVDNSGGCKSGATLSQGVRRRGGSAPSVCAVCPRTLSINLEARNPTYPHGSARVHGVAQPPWTPGTGTTTRGTVNMKQNSRLQRAAAPRTETKKQVRGAGHAPSAEPQQHVYYAYALEG